MFSTAQQVRELFSSFEGKKVMIVGDVMIDSYLKGTVDRISPEAPVPVVLLHHKENLLGGAANVALNVQALGAKPILCSVIGDDVQGAEFIKLIEKATIDNQGIIQSSSRITTTKYRVIGNKMQMLRVDHETNLDLDEETEKLAFKRINELVISEKPNVIILQDYNKGMLTASLIEKIIQLAGVKKIPVVVDPKQKNFKAYHSVALFKPNLKEIREGLKIDVDGKSLDSLNKAALLIHSEQNTDIVMITLSEDGVFVSNRNLDSNESAILNAHVRTIADVSGAGDTVISVAALCLAAGQSPVILAGLANLAGGLVCEQVGVVPVNKKALLDEAIALLTLNI